MAEHIWISTTGDFTAAASWSTATAVTAWNAGDSALFDGTSQVSVTTNLQPTPATGPLTQLTVTEDYEGDIGTSVNPLDPAGTNFLTVVYRGQGTLYWRDSGGTNTLVRVDSPNLVDAVVYPASGRLAGLAVKRGKVIIAATGGVTTALNAFILCDGQYAHIEFTSGDTNALPGYVHCKNGTLDLSQRGWTAAASQLIVAGGFVTLRRLVDLEALLQYGGYIDFRIPAGQTVGAVVWQFVSGLGDWSHTQNATFSADNRSFIGADYQVIDGPYVQNGNPGGLITNDMRRDYP